MSHSPARLPLAGLIVTTLALGACSSGDDVLPPTPNTAPTITLTAPGASAAYAPGSNLSIEWTATDDNAVVGVDLSYTADGNKSGSITAGASGSSYSWALPDEMLFGVVITATARDAEGLTASDMTDNIFAVVPVSERGYVTSSVCATCHAQSASAVATVGHGNSVTKVEGGQQPVLPFTSVPAPSGYAWSDISYLIGGYGWKARFMDQNGYVLTTGATGVDVQYNLPRSDLSLGSQWVAYEAGDASPKPYTCGQCHDTGWQSLAENGGVNQDDLEGIHGTWEESGVGCEACHGPGAEHVAAKDPSRISIDTSSQLCGSCHSRDGNPDLLAADGFIRSQGQHEELRMAGHGVRSCVDCHDPHIGTQFGKADVGGIKVTCESCHADKEANNNHFGVSGLECVTCHMPRATKSAQATNSYSADMRTHIFKINPNPVTKDGMFYPSGGSTYTQGFITLDFACYTCHRNPDTGEGGNRSMKSIQELSARAIGIHN
jgi:hypothetical protein